MDPSGQACCLCLQEFQDGPWSQQNLDPSACMLIPVTGPRGGAVVVGESTICYFHDSQPMRACQIDATLIRVSGFRSQQLLLCLVQAGRWA